MVVPRVQKASWAEGSAWASSRAKSTGCSSSVSSRAPPTRPLAPATSAMRGEVSMRRMLSTFPWRRPGACPPNVRFRCGATGGASADGRALSRGPLHRGHLDHALAAGTHRALGVVQARGGEEGGGTHAVDGGLGMQGVAPDGTLEAHGELHGGGAAGGLPQGGGASDDQIEERGEDAAVDGVGAQAAAVLGTDFRQGDDDLLPLGEAQARTKILHGLAAVELLGETIELLLGWIGLGIGHGATLLVESRTCLVRRVRSPCCWPSRGAPSKGDG